MGSRSGDLTKAGHDVVLIDQWPENVEAMRRRGARIEMPDETLEVPVRAYNICDVCTFADRFDIVLLVVKAYDTRWASHLIAPYLKPDGLLAGVQNGMTTDIIAEVVGPQRTIGCVIESRRRCSIPAFRCATRHLLAPGSPWVASIPRRAAARSKSPHFSATRAPSRSSTTSGPPSG